MGQLFSRKNRCAKLEEKLLELRVSVGIGLAKDRWRGVILKGVLPVWDEVVRWLK